MSAVGVDGWKAGWIAATLEGDKVVWHPYPQRRGEVGAFVALLTDFATATIAVDVPIGVTDGQRSADDAARRFLKGKGATQSSIFSTPTRVTLAAFEEHGDHARAMREREQQTLGTSIQAWGLLPKIIEVRDALAATPNSTVFEAHPECSFREMDPDIGSATKHGGRGVGLRLRALQRQGIDIDLLTAPAAVPIDDLLDAAAMLWTAHRISTGAAITLPDAPEPGEPAIVV